MIKGITGMTIVDNKSRYHYFNAFDEEGEIIGGAAVDVTDTMHYRYKSLCKADNTKCGEIVYVKVDKAHRGQGIAKSLLERIIHDYKNYDLFLFVCPQDKKQEKLNSVETLTKYYEKFGFKRCENPGNVPTMIKQAEI